jgi:hypothetical protein
MSMVRFTLAALTALAALAVPLAAAAMTSSPGIRNVTCDESVAATRFPYLGNNQPRYQYRLVLGTASVPPAYLQQVVATHDRPWKYWRKAGRVIRWGSEQVTITVPTDWRTRAAITWGNGGQGVSRTIRFTGCGSKPHSGYAYPGGVYLTTPSACLPLVIRVRTRTATVRFGIGEEMRLSCAIAGTATTATTSVARGKLAA